MQQIIRLVARRLQRAQAVNNYAVGAQRSSEIHEARWHEVSRQRATAGRRLAFEQGHDCSLPKHAIDEGWLIVGGSLRSAYREFYPALPDRLVAQYPRLLSDQDTLLSELAGQIMHPTAAQPSEGTGTRVRNGGLVSPTGSDKSLISPSTSEDPRAEIRSQVAHAGIVAGGSRAARRGRFA